MAAITIKAPTPKARGKIGRYRCRFSPRWTMVLEVGRDQDPGFSQMAVSCIGLHRALLMRAQARIG